MEHFPKAYAEDLAFIHDAGFGGFARAAAQFVLQRLEAAGKHSGLVVELGCGSGITAEILTNAGYAVVGFDISEAMIELARARVPAAQFQQRSFVDLDLPRCDAVIAIGEVLNYRFDAKVSSVRLAKLFRNVNAALHPEGFFLFDGAEPGRVVGPGPTKGFTEGKDWVCLYVAEEDADHQNLTRTITTFRKIGESYRRDDEVHRLELFSRDAIQLELTRIGFAVEDIEGYIDLPFPAGYVGFLARKTDNSE